MRKIYYCFAIAIMAVSCGIDPVVEDEYEPQYYIVKDSIQLTKAETETANQVREFGIKYFKEAVIKYYYKHEHPEGNVLISPFMISYGVSVMSAGFKFDTDEEIQSIFGPDNSSFTDVLLYHKKVKDKLATEGGGIDIGIANAVWLDSQRDRTSKFSEYVDIMNSYLVHVDSLNFPLYGDHFSVDYINAWTAKATGNKIDKAYFKSKSDTVSGLSRIVENALSFNGLWNTDSYETTEMEFCDKNGDFNTRTFFGLDSLFYFYKDEYISSIVLPYVKDSYQMIVIMSNLTNDIKQCVSSITAESFDKILSEAKLSRVNFRMPVFEETLPEDLVEARHSQLYLSSIMYKTAKSELFNLNEGHFSEAFKNREYPSPVGSWSELSLSIRPDGVSVKSVPNFNWTKDWGYYVRSGAINPTHYDFIVNRPFVYAIVERTTGALLFMGTHVI